MKYLLVLALALLVYFMWRGQRIKSGPRAPDAAPPLPQHMVRCHVCALHLPRAEALEGAQARFYCCAEHRRTGER